MSLSLFVVRSHCHEEVEFPALLFPAALIFKHLACRSVSPLMNWSRWEGNSWEWEWRRGGGRGVCEGRGRLVGGDGRGGTRGMQG